MNFNFLKLVFVLFLMNVANANAQEQYDWFRKNTIKVSPYFAGVNYNGGSILVETSAGVRYMSIQLGYRYAFGPEKLDTLSTYNKHQRLEIQPRFWLQQHMRWVYFAPSMIFYNSIFENNDNWSFGGSLGVQALISKRFAIDLFAGIYRNNLVENKEYKFNKQPMFPRLGISVGYQFVLPKSRNTQTPNN
jgi:hypothetical protein